jgi:hypothetical protein
VKKQVTKLARHPFFITLADRAISMYVDPDTGAIFIDEGAGKDRMNGAAIPAFKRPKFTCTPAGSGCMLKLECGTFVWEAGSTENVKEAASWVKAVNRFLDSKRGFADSNGKLRGKRPKKGKSRKANPAKRSVG